MKRIYLDNAATTKIDKQVFAAMEPYLKQDFGNPSSLHWFGEKAHEAVSKSRQQVADFLGCNFLEVFFTGSATESDNLAILGVVKAAQKKGIAKPHIITSAIEHPAVLEPIKYLEKAGEIEATYLAVGKEGIIKIEDVEKSIKENTVLVSIMYANNEIGAIQPIAEMTAAIGRHPERSEGSPYPLFHTDAVQGANYLDCNVNNLGCDLLTLSGHKIYGPKGIGILYKRKGVDLEPVIFGGHQEKGVRPGTENVAAIVGFGESLKNVLRSTAYVQQIKKLRDKLLNGILTSISGTFLNGSQENRLPNNANISFDGVEGESILMALNEKGIAVSTGSACASGSLEPSYVLMALGVGIERAHSSIRFTLGKYNTKKEIDYVLKVLPEIIKKLRAISPLK
ncbi:MAG: cysteine desulfurase family protein [Candidatus Pacebacteria bacterium]|nr:cysteine desulfurase family protein [Candidatus Paceibacterota bacterium]